MRRLAVDRSGALQAATRSLIELAAQDRFDAGSDGATIEIAADFGPGSTWRTPATCKFYDTLGMEIDPFGGIGDASAMAGKSFAWDEDADGVGTAGWRQL